MSLTYGPGARFDPGYTWDDAVTLAHDCAVRVGSTSAIARFPDGTHRVYHATAWQAPNVAGMLPWSAPPFPPVALIDPDGTVTPC